MDQFNQTNNLQQAIDEVAGSKDDASSQFGVPPMPPTEGDGAPAPFGESASNDSPSAEQILSGAVAPGAPVAEASATETPAPAVDATAPAVESAAAPAVETPAAPAAPAVETPTVETPAPVETPVAAPAETSAEAPADGDLASIRENVIKDLVGVIDKVDNATPEEKFGVYEEAMKTMHDAKTIGGAYRTATQISDENKKADALMGLMRTIDNA